MRVKNLRAVLLSSLLILGGSSPGWADELSASAEKMSLHAFRSTAALEAIRGEGLTTESTVDLQIRRDDGSFETVRKEVAIASVERTAVGTISAVFVRLTPSEKQQAATAEGVVRLWVEPNPSRPTMPARPTPSEIDLQLPGARLRIAIQRDSLGGDHGSEGDDGGTIEVYPNYALANERDDSGLWNAVHDAFGNGPYDGSQVAILRVFLEDERSDDKVTVLPRPGQTFFPVSAKIPNHHGTSGAFADRSSGQFIGVLRGGRQPTSTVSIESPRHLPAELRIEWPDTAAITCRDVMLRKPSEDQRGQMVVSLEDADGEYLPEWKFLFGATTFGGPYGESSSLSSGGLYFANSLASQTFEVGFSQRMHQKWRHEVLVKPGVVTRLEFALNENEELMPPVVTYKRK